MYVEQKQQQHIRVTNGQPLATDQTQGTGGRDKLQNAQVRAF